MGLDVVALAQLLELPDAVVYSVASETYRVFGKFADPFVSALTKLDTFQWLVDFSARTQDAHAAKLPLMNIGYVFFAVVFYAVALAVLYPVGKLLGKHKYRFIGLIHNAFLFFLSVYMCVGIAVTATAAGYRLWNNPVGRGPLDWSLAKFHWLFYVSKLPEFGDTFLMMLKQNYRQISFLHLYHHASVFVFWFFVVNIGPGGEAYWSAMLNSGVHVVMYGYYAGTLLFTDGPVRRFLNNFKFVITKGQMTQFGLNCVQSVYDLFIVPRAELLYPAGLIGTYFAYMLTLLALFSNFLIRNQGKAEGSPASSPVTRTTKKKQ